MFLKPKSRLSKTQHQSAFTLAEVLITLSIIGVVAALTIPSLISKNQEKETIVKLQKAYNTFSKAYLLAIIDYGDPSLWDWGARQDSIAAERIMDMFSPYLNITKNCGVGKGCWGKNVMYKKYTKGDWGIMDNITDRAKAILADGTYIYAMSEGNSCHTNYGLQDLEFVCGGLGIDINGPSGPNTIGKDTFAFYITQNGIIPLGTPNDRRYSIKTQCRNSVDGWGCTAWAIIKQNMDYPAAGTGWE